MEWTTILSAILGIVAVVAGGFWLNAKGKIIQLADIARETLELISVLSDALEDNKITKDEVETLKREASEVVGAWKALIGKK